VYVFLYAPAILVVVFSFNSSRFWAFPLRGFTLRWYAEMLTRVDALEAVRNSFVVALPTMALAVLVGGGAGLAFFHWRLRAKGAAEGTMLLPQLIPSLIWGLGLLVFLTWLRASLGPISVIMGHVILTTPYVVLLIRTRFHSLDPNLEDAARGLGAGSGTIFRRIVLPHLSPALISGALIAFAISFSDLILAFFLTGGGFNTLPVFIYALIELEPSPVINAVASVVFGVAVLAILAALMASGREALFVGRHRRDE
jgi:spermidine/putrescine transport system permease protein